MKKLMRLFAWVNITPKNKLLNIFVAGEVKWKVSNIFISNKVTFSNFDSDAIVDLIIAVV